MTSSRTRARSWYAKCGVAGPTRASTSEKVGSDIAGSLVDLGSVISLPREAAHASADGDRRTTLTDPTAAQTPAHRNAPWFPAAKITWQPAQQPNDGGDYEAASCD